MNIRNNTDKVEKMNASLSLDQERLGRIIELKASFMKGEISAEDAREKAADFGHITPEEFAFAEQNLILHGVDDAMLEEKLEDLIDVFKDVLDNSFPDLPEGHPIHTYLEENKKIRELTYTMEDMLTGKFILNPWLEVYEKLLTIETHYDRKQNQIFPYLERKGFDKPTSVMWTLDNQIKKTIKNHYASLKSDTIFEETNSIQFLRAQLDLIRDLRDMIFKEEQILYPTALEMLTEDEFITIRKGDDEIGYCLIDPPKSWGMHADQKLPESPLAESGLINLGQGLLTVEQINLIFKHLPVDVSFVDENEIVRFYNDIPHRIFPRSPGVIGREVQNCHPRESVGTVMRIVEAFKSGKKDTAEFWLEIAGKFLHIQYFAVKNEKGEFKGILEMMQDATHVRSLEGSNRLLNWDDEAAEEQQTPSTSEDPTLDYTRQVGDMKLSGDTKLQDILDVYPSIKPFLINFNPKFKNLKNDMLFKMMSKIADLNGISKRGQVSLKSLIDGIADEIERGRESRS
ncbi:MAG: PAS domain-containing protein [Clostridiales bacterium]|nr:PAS domain-containing protein [Clostridiales bacterium]